MAKNAFKMEHPLGTYFNLQENFHNYYVLLFDFSRVLFFLLGSELLFFFFFGVGVVE